MALLEDDDNKPETQQPNESTKPGQSEPNQLSEEIQASADQTRKRRQDKEAATPETKRPRVQQTKVRDADEDGGLAIPSPPRMFESEESPADGNHGGRIRTFPHIQGNFATHVFVAVEWSADLTKRVSGILETLKAKLHPTLVQLTWPPEPLHLSLSRTVFLRRHLIDGFVAHIGEALTSHSKFVCELTWAQYFHNDVRTRNFVGLCVGRNSSSVVQLIRSVDNVFARYSLPPFYQDPIPHATIAWDVGEAPESAQQWREEGFQIKLRVSEVQLKVGNKLHRFQLKGLPP
eukprot:c53363_g1_i1.p1 GENE.c53363_g1_i1~~c53363_g1_i1.p1  ORF type:complete len:318 (-),score=68.22 c53363_g1_i1:116-985(-)